MVMSFIILIIQSQIMCITYNYIINMNKNNTKNIIICFFIVTNILIRILSVLFLWNLA